jgi:hypothetical protein
VLVLAAVALGLIALAFARTWAYGSHRAAEGGERVEPGPVPWFEWAFLAVCAGAVIAVARLWRRAGRGVHSAARPE